MLAVALGGMVTLRVMELSALRCHADDTVPMGVFMDADTLSNFAGTYGLMLICLYPDAAG